MLSSIRYETIPGAEAFDPSAYAPTFAASSFRPCRIHGPASLIRLVQGGRYSMLLTNPGEYWIDGAYFERFLAQSRAEIAAQGHDPEGPFPGLHARFQLRDTLAVSRDWSHLDSYIELHLPSGESLVALVGKAAGQPYYSDRQATDQARAEAAGIRLPGRGEQIVVDFKHSANRDAVRFVRGPFLF